MSSLSAPVLRVPFAASVPVHPPEAVQDVAFAEVHVNVAESPASIVFVDAFNDTVGCGLTGLEPPPPHADNASAALSTRSRETSPTTSPLAFVIVCYRACASHAGTRN